MNYLVLTVDYTNAKAAQSRTSAMSSLQNSDQNAIPAHRNFKNRGMGVEDGRAKRLETTVQLRKASRNEKLMKRRNIRAGKEVPSEAEQTGLSSTAHDIDAICAQLYSKSPAEVQNALTAVRKVLSKDHDPPINEVIMAGAVPRLVQLLDDGIPPEMQFEAAWALTNIASGDSDETRVVLEQGGVLAFVRLLGSSNQEVRDQCVWALGNIAGDSIQCRNYVLQYGGLEGIMEFLASDNRPITAIRTATWTLSNLCRGQKAPQTFASVKKVLPVLANLIQSNDTDVLVDASWALSYMSDGDDSRIQAVLDAGVVDRLVALLHHPNTNVKSPALRVLGHIVTGNEIQTQVVLNAGVLTCLQTLMQCDHPNLRKEACWTLSNIGAGNKQQVEAIAEANLLPLLIEHASHDQPMIKKEAMWGLVNVMSGCGKGIVHQLVRQGVISPMVAMMELNTDADLLQLLLDGIGRILKIGSLDMGNQYAVYFEEAGGLDKLENLQGHCNDAIYQKAYEIITTYFGEEDFSDDENIAPNATDTHFEFNVGQDPSANGMPSFGF